MVAQNPPRKKRRGCFSCTGCLAAIIVVPLVLVALLWGGSVLLDRIGLLNPAAEDLYSGAADPVASEAMETVMVEAGIEGARAVVLPVEGSSGQLVVITIDSGTSLSGTGEGIGEEALMQALRGLSQANRDGDLNLERAVVDWRDENGEPFASITASQATIDAYANGEMSRQEFLSAVDVDVSQLLDLIELDSITRGE
jgi:hypothetical protein